MYVFCAIAFSLFYQLTVLSRSPCSPPPNPANIARTAVQNVTSTSTQHSAGQLALSAQAPRVIVINSLFALNNHGPLLPAPFI